MCPAQFLTDRRCLKTLAVLAVAFLTLVPGNAAEPGKAETGAAGLTPFRKPAVYFCDFNVGKYNSAVIREFLEAGFEVEQGGGDYPKYRWLLTWDEMKKFNVIALVGTPSVFSKENAELLNRYLREGGGVLWMPMLFCNDWDASRPYLKELGIEVFAEYIRNPAKEFVFKIAPGGRQIDALIAWTDDIAKSPITEGVKNLWYPANHLSHAYGAAPLWLSPAWTPLVKTGPGAHTVTRMDDRKDGFLELYGKEFAAKYSNFKGREGDFTLVAVRDFDKGRLAAISVDAQLLLWSGYIPSYNGVLMKTGAQGRPSDWAKLFVNLFKYLAEPSLKNGGLGGYVTRPANLFTLEPGDPEPQFKEDMPFPPLPGKVQVGIAGAHSSLSTGRNTVKEWCEAARQAGYDFLIFADDMKKMNAEKWLQLRKECKENSSAAFLAFPGIEFEMELGDRGFYMDDLGFWPNDKYCPILTKDGRVYSKRGKDYGSIAKLALDFRSGMDRPPDIASWGQLAMGHFSHRTNPTPWWNHNLYQTMSVFTREDDKILDDWTIPEFLEVNAQTLHIAPLALNLMTEVGQLPKPLTKGYGYMTWPGSLTELHDKLSTYGSYAYNGLSTPAAVTDGPIVKQWQALGSLAYTLPRWGYPYPNFQERDFYATQNYRIRLRLNVESAAGLKEVAIHDGMRLWRRYLVGGEKTFDITLDALNDDKSHFVAVITDIKGGKAVTAEIETENWLSRLYFCSDRCNFGTTPPYNHSQGMQNPVSLTTIGTNRLLLNRWTFPFWGPDCGLVQGNAEKMFARGADAASGHSSFYDTETIPQFTWINKRYFWYQKHGNRFIPREDYVLQGWDQTMQWDRPPSGNKPFYSYDENEDAYRFKEDVTFDNTGGAWSIRPFQWAGNIAPDKDSEYEFRLGDKTLAGKIPKDKNIELHGDAPDGAIFALRLHAGTGNPIYQAQAGTVIAHGANLRYSLVAGGTTMRLQIGWQENGRTVPAGTERKARYFVIGNRRQLDGFVFGSEMMKEFLGPEAGFSARELDLLQSADWYKVNRGTVTNTMLPLGIRVQDYAAAVSVPEFPFPMNSCPLVVSGLNPGWTVYYCEPGDTMKRRPVTVSPEGETRVQFDRRKKNVDAWVGHPVVCSNAEDIRFDLIDAGNGRFIMEANNIGDRKRDVEFRPGADCPFLQFKPFRATIGAGEHKRFTAEFNSVEVK